MADKDSEIKNLLTRIISDYESVLKEQRERILQLREENRRFAAENEALRKKEGEIGKAMLLAVAKAREIDEASKLRYRTEMQRLREFHVRWKKYYDCLYQLAPSEDYEKLRTYLRKMDGVFDGEMLLGENGLEAAHRSETERVRLREAELGKDPDAEFRDLFDRKDGAPGLDGLIDPDKGEEGAAAIAESAGTSAAESRKTGDANRNCESIPEDAEFNLDDVLYPKNLPDLASLCEELGLNQTEK